MPQSGVYVLSQGNEIILLCKSEKDTEFDSFCLPTIVISAAVAKMQIGVLNQKSYSYHNAH
jgi:hypothetical protein